NASLLSDNRGHVRIVDYNETRSLRDLGAPSMAVLFTMAWGGEPMTIALYAWMRAIFATKDGDIALWKTGKFVEKLAERYGHNRDVVSTPRLEVTALRDHRFRRRQAE